MLTTVRSGHLGLICNDLHLVEYMHRLEADSFRFRAYEVSFGWCVMYIFASRTAQYTRIEGLLPRLGRTRAMRYLHRDPSGAIRGCDRVAVAFRCNDS